MSLRRYSVTLFAAAFIVSVFAGATIAKAASAPAIFQKLPGTWTCTSHGSNGARSATYTFRNINANTIQYSFVGRMRPNRSGAGVWYYDAKKNEYVFMGAGPNGWGVSRASASPGATMLHVVDTYPSDPMNGTSTFSFSGNKATTASRWRQNGKAMTQSGTCTKS